MGWAERRNPNSEYNKKRGGNLATPTREKKLPDIIRNKFTFTDRVKIFFIFLRKLLVKK